MFEIQLIPALLIFMCGTIVGITLTLLFNKMRTGSASAGKIKQEMEDYQGQVEAHFEETSKKFKDMAAQYQDLYKHLSVGATTLCRSENSIAGLSDLRDPLSMAPKIEPPIKKTEAADSKVSHTGEKLDKVETAISEPRDSASRATKVKHTDQENKGDKKEKQSHSVGRTEASKTNPSKPEPSIPSSSKTQKPV